MRLIYNLFGLSFFEGNGEILDDILRHGSHDVVWCFDYERLVSTYVNIKSNNKDNEISYTNFHRRRLLTRVLMHIQNDRDNLMPHQRLCQELHASMMLPTGYIVGVDSNVCHNWHNLGIHRVSSISKAKDFWKAHIACDMDYPCGQSLNEKGIVIGKKKQVWRSLSREEERFVRHHNYNVSQVSEHKKVWFKGEVYKLGDHVVVKCDDGTSTTENVGEWKACIRSFFSMQCNGELKLFFGANYYRQSILIQGNSERLNVDVTTGMSVLQNAHLPFSWDCIREISSLLHKFFPWKIDNTIIAYETKDLFTRKRLLQAGHVGCPPPWLEKDDVVQVTQLDNISSSVISLSYAVVREVDTEMKKVQLASIIQVNDSNGGKWKTDIEDEAWRDWSCCVAIVSGWKVLKKRRVLVNRSRVFLPCMWQA